MKIRYSESIVLFLDVLGFSSLVYNKDKSRIEEYFSYVESHFNKELADNRFKYLIISDSIVISTKKTKENLSELIFVMSKIQYQLLLRGILIRGAISFGKLYVNKLSNIIVGPGLINAYKLENSAKYPRIIIDRQLIPELFHSTNGFFDYINAFFLSRYGETDSKVKFGKNVKDGKPYVNFIRTFVRDRRSYGNRNLEKVIHFLSSNFFYNEHFEKYNWLIEELKDELTLGILHYEGHPEISSSRLKIKKLKSFQLKLDSI